MDVSVKNKRQEGCEMEEVQANQELKLDELQMVIFRLANEEYALPITKE